MVAQIACGETRYVTFRADLFGAGSIDHSSGDYIVGTNLTVTASTNANFTFVKWLGDVPSSNQTDNPLVILITSTTKLVEADFSIISVDFTTLAAGATTATVFIVDVPIHLGSGLIKARLFVDLTGSGDTVIDCQNVNEVRAHITIAADTTLSLSNVMNHTALVVSIAQSDTNNFAITWDSDDFKFTGSAPTNDYLTGRVSVYSFEYLTVSGALQYGAIENVATNQP